MSRIALSVTLLVACTACSTALGLNDVTRGDGGEGELDRISALEGKVAMLQASQDAMLDALKPVAFRASLGLAQTVPSSGASGTIVAFDKVELDTHGAFDTQAHKYVVPVPGQYIVIAIVGYSGMDNGRANCEIWVDQSGSTSKSETAVTTAGNSSGTGAALVRVTSATAVQLDAGDRVYVKAFHDNGLERTLITETRSTNLQIIRVPTLK
jgi:hypothetical protein